MRRGSKQRLIVIFSKMESKLEQKVFEKCNIFALAMQNVRINQC